MSGSRRHIAIIGTGGTIADGKPTDSNRKHQSVTELAAGLSRLNGIEIVTKDLFDLPSTFLTFDHMNELAAKIKLAIEEGADGVIVTHGTDTLEESAYFVDLVQQSDRPIVFTGAMLPPGVPGADGPYNLRCALLTAASDHAVGRGVLVVFAGEIHAARDVAKAHSVNVAAFQSIEFGPIGHVVEDRVLFARTAPATECLPIASVTAQVEGTKCYAGMSDIQLRALTAAKVDGIVLEALGSGQVPPWIMPAIREAADDGIVLAATTRCPTGALMHNHFGLPLRVDGDECDLLESGVLFSNLQGVKARVRLAVALSAGLTRSELRDWF